MSNFVIFLLDQIPSNCSISITFNSGNKRAIPVTDGVCSFGRVVVNGKRLRVDDIARTLRFISTMGREGVFSALALEGITTGSDEMLTNVLHTLNSLPFERRSMVSERMCVLANNKIGLFSAVRDQLNTIEGKISEGVERLRKIKELGTNLAARQGHVEEMIRGLEDRVDEKIGENMDVLLERQEERLREMERKVSAQIEQLEERVQKFYDYCPQALERQGGKVANGTNDEFRTLGEENEKGGENVATSSNLSVFSCDKGKEGKHVIWAEMVDNAEQEQGRIPAGRDQVSN